jgi:hypothetical protein
VIESSEAFRASDVGTASTSDNTNGNVTGSNSNADKFDLDGKENTANHAAHHLHSHSQLLWADWHLQQFRGFNWYILSRGKQSAAASARPQNADSDAESDESDPEEETKGAKFNGSGIGSTGARLSQLPIQPDEGGYGYMCMCVSVSDLCCVLYVLIAQA